MSKDNVVAFFNHLQGDEELQQQFQDEFNNKGQLSMERILESAEAVGMKFSVGELHAAVKDQVDTEMDDAQLESVVGGVFDLRGYLAGIDFT